MRFNPTSLKNKFGFTIIELVIVIVVIGILSAVVYVGYGGVQAQARDASVLSDLDTLDGLMTNYALENNVVGKAYYSGEYGAGDVDLEFTPSEGNVIDAVIDDEDYCIRGYNPDGTKDSINNVFEKESSDGACDRIPPSAMALGESSVGITVTGGIEAIDGSYTVRTFTSSGTLSISGGTIAGASVLIVAGGKSGGGYNMDHGGDGGDGGQVVTLTNQELTGDISVIVGSSSQNSSFGANIATTGSGASGGDGGTIYGNPPTNGSNGTLSDISGSSLYYGGGGGGGGANSSGASGGLSGGGDGGDSTEDGSSWGSGDDGESGIANTGGGGGGAGAAGVNMPQGGAGGSGVVIIRYLTP